MLKHCIALIGLLGLTACNGLVETNYATREYSGHVGGCPGLTGVSAIYSQSASGLPVRCGPQAAAPVTYR